MKLNTILFCKKLHYFNNFKQEYKDQMLSCGLESLLVNTEKRCKAKYGEHCQPNKNGVSYGIRCPEGYVKYKNYFCYIKCPKNFIERYNHCVKPQHLKVIKLIKLTFS